MVKQEIYRKLGYAIQTDEERLKVQLEAIQAELNAPTQFKVSPVLIQASASLALCSSKPVLL